MTSSTFWWANEVCGSVPKALAILGTPTVVAVLWYKDEVDVPVVVRDVRIPVAHLDAVRDVRIPVDIEARFRDLVHADSCRGTVVQR